MNTELISTLKQAIEYLKESNINKPHFIKEATKVLKQAEKLGSTKQKTIELAGQFLAGDGDVEAAIKTIIWYANNEDENELIDYVDGIDVWEKVKFSFTCGQFLREINYLPSDWK